MGYVKLLTYFDRHGISGLFVKLFFLILTVTVSIPIMAQGERTISGTVTDQSGSALTGVTVMIPGTTQGTSTDALGSYIINVGDAEYLEFNCLGYKTQRIKLAGQAVVSVIMEEDKTSLDEIVVIGYGVQKRRDIVGAVETLSTDDVKERFGSQMNISHTLQGTIPGLTMTFSDGKPTRDATIRIRGTENSIGAGGDALVLLDGVEVSLNTVNPQDIASVTVLKDASSTAVYGARGTFGVILLTSKTPEKGSAKITYDGSFSVYQRTVKRQFVTDSYDYLTAFAESYTYGMGGTQPTGVNGRYTFTQEWMEEIRNRKNDPTASNYRLNANGEYEYLASGINWYDLFYRNAWVGHQHNITASGGSDIASYYVSGRFFQQDGQYHADAEKFNQYNILAKGTINIKPWLHLTETADLLIRKSHDNTGWYSDEDRCPVDRMLQTECFPFVPPTNPDGTWTKAAVNSGYAAMVDGLQGWNKKYTEFGSKTVIQLDMIKDVLWATADFGYRYSHNDDVLHVQDDTYYTSPTNAVTTNYTFMQEFVTDSERVTGDVTLNYVPRIGENHYLGFLVGWNIENYKYGSTEMYRTSMMTDTPNWDLVEGDKMRISDHGTYEWGMVGAFYRINYSYKSKYLIETSGRYDGSSKFPSNQRWGFFPSGSVGWRISEEGFMKNATWLDNLKIRFSIGSAGNGLISDAYAYMSTMSLNQSNLLNNGSTFKYTGAPEPIPDELTWEKAVTYDVGLDFEAFDGRLNIVGDWYRKNTVNMYVVGEELPAVYGNSAPKGNYADMRTNGWEVSAGWRESYNVGGKPLSYFVKAAVWDSRSFITRYTSKTGTLPTIYKTSYYEGMELGEIWGYVCNGLFQTDEDVAKYDLTQFLHDAIKFQAGDVKYEDLNNDGAINNGSNTISDHGDLVKIGNMSPRYNYSFSAGISWNGIGLTFMFQGVGKRDWYPARECGWFWGMYSRPYGMTFPWHADRWSETNRDAYWPLMVAWDAQEPTGLLSSPNTRYLQNARYLRLKNVTIDYTFSTKAAKKIGLAGLKVYFSMENPLVFTPLHKYAKNFDPEGISAGDADYYSVIGSGYSADGDGYPVLKSYTIGLSITL